ncbi:hypothetical protein NHQ30_010590 [Ciborinia camelliae]|nr:hypothetical protein NHQ30_010590 [Ciborinia camelliae]
MHLWFNGQQYTAPNSIQVESQEGAKISPPEHDLSDSSEDLLVNVRHKQVQKSLLERRRQPYERFDVWGSIIEY